MAENEFIDYYELLQISPNAELETINRVFKMLATRYHPDNPETGDVDRFLVLNQAFEVLTDPKRRSDYDTHYAEHRLKPLEVFETKDFEIGVDGEANRRMGILCLLYNRRRSDPDDPGLSLLEFETMMSYAREHLLFTMWYLKEHDYVRMDEKSDYLITAQGVDFVEQNLPQNKLMYKLLKAAETGTSRTSTREAGTAEPAGTSRTN
jgi:curved DNA-binding protein CbpA